MGAPRSAVSFVERLTEIVGQRATIARGVLDDHSRNEAYHKSAPPGVVVFPETT